MKDQTIILERKYIQLKQCLVDGKIELFEKEIAKLQFDELMEFSNYAYANYKGNDFLEDYYGIKVLGELTYLISTREILVLNPEKFEQDKFWDLVYIGLVSAAHHASDLGYYQDAEKYGLQVIKNPKLDKSILLSILSILATCANKKMILKKNYFIVKKC